MHLRWVEARSEGSRRGMRMQGVLLPHALAGSDLVPLKIPYLKQPVRYASQMRSTVRANIREAFLGSSRYSHDERRVSIR